MLSAELDCRLRHVCTCAAAQRRSMLCPGGAVRRAAMHTECKPLLVCGLHGRATAMATGIDAYESVSLVQVGESGVASRPSQWAVCHVERCV
eukprot:5165716-Prymnesium_polylepis.1